MNESITTFGLTFQQMRILFSLEYYITRKDADAEEKFIDKINFLAADHANKKLWLGNFEKEIINFMKETNSNEANECSLIKDTAELREAILKEERNSDRDIWKYLVILECILFNPYFPMTEEDIKNKTYKGLSLDDDIKHESVNTIASWLDINHDQVKALREAYESGIKKMTGYWNKVFIGIGAGVVAALLAVVTCGGSIAALFAASGLYGAAAVSSGLAALGGGAIAAGGFGMAGGMAVLIGGGVLLGTGAGASVSMALAETNPSGVMNECAKMYVVLKEIILGIQNDTLEAQQILSGVVDKVASLKKEIVELRIQQAKNKEKIKNLEKSIEYLEKFLTMFKK
ncbi:MAG: hypothetical protein K2K75_14045 [Muribaculaceae bacterium]|nr:hypothetical protein [Muribaculaceae bacterium]